MKNHKAWFALAAVMAFLACALFVEGHGTAVRNEATLQAIKYFDGCVGRHIERHAFTSYLGVPNTDQDVREAHEFVRECREATVRWLEDRQLHTKLSPEATEFLNHSWDDFDSELAARVAATEPLPRSLANVGVPYPSAKNPSVEDLTFCLAAAIAFLWMGISRRSSQSGNANDQRRAHDASLHTQESTYSIDTRIFDADDEIDEDLEDFEDDFEEDIDPEREVLCERLRLEREEFAAEKRAARELEQERRVQDRLERAHSEDERRAQEKRADRERRNRDADEKLRRQKEGERQQREDAARRRVAENRSKDEERKARDKQRREAAAYAQREREHEIVFSMKGGGFHTVSAGSASGARMAAEARLRSSSNVSGYVIRNKNGKVVGSG